MLFVNIIKLSLNKIKWYKVLKVSYSEVITIMYWEYLLIKTIILLMHKIL